MITILSGTNRIGSKTLQVSRIVESIYRDDLKVKCRLLNLMELPSDLFTPESYATKPTSFAPFNDAVLEASGLVVVTPEYNGSFPGVLKLFIDMLKFPESFQHKPVCFVGLAAGRWGALRSVEQLQQIFTYRNAHIFPERTFMPGINDLLDPEGTLKDSELADRLRRQAEGFYHFINRLTKTSGS